MSTLGNEQNLSIRHAAAPLTVFLSQEAISCSRRHSNIIMFILKYFHCVIESTLGICLSPLSATSTSNLFASCHQPSVPAVFTELSNRYDMFWLQIKFFSSHWRPRTEKLAVLSSSAAIGLCAPVTLTAEQIGAVVAYEHFTFLCPVQKQKCRIA